MRNEFTQKQHQTEVNNFTDDSQSRQKDLLKRHTLNQKQLPKNIKVEIHCSRIFPIVFVFFRSNKQKSNDNIKKHTIINIENIKQ